MKKKADHMKTTRDILLAWGTMIALVLFLGTLFPGCFLGEPQGGPTGKTIEAAQTRTDVTREDVDRGSVKLTDYIPGWFKPGERLMGQRILDVRDVGEGFVVVTENPFLYREHMMVLPDGSDTGIPCAAGVNLEKQPIEVLFPDGANLPQMAMGLHNAYFGAAYHALVTHQSAPLFWHCAENGGLMWWQGPGEYDDLLQVLHAECPDGDGWETCERQKCDAEAQYEHMWATRQVHAALRWDMQAKANIALWFVIEGVIQSGMAPEDLGHHDAVAEFMLGEYRGILGQEGVIEQTFHAIEANRIVCLDQATGNPTGVNPHGQAPNCAFSWGLGPVAFTWNADGSWTISGGEGAIVSVTHDPKSGETQVGVGFGVQGHIGPYSIELTGGVNVPLKDMDVSLFGDASLSAGPLSCSVTGG